MHTGLETDCPVSGAHGRLLEAHVLWHQAADAYEHPERFLTNLNALIQALRNVTFALQAEKRAIPNFASWYAHWQKRMRADPVLRWVVDSRNQVVKQSDLDVHSRAVVKVHALWGAQPIFSHPAPMGWSAEQIVAAAPLPPLPDWVQRRGVFAIERRWVLPGHPRAEALEVLAIAYARLSRLLADAHRQCGTQYVHGASGDCPELPLARDGRPVCMSTTEDMRTAAKCFDDGAPLERMSKRWEAPTGKRMRQLDKRMQRHPDSELIGNGLYSDDLEEQARAMLGVLRFARSKGEELMVHFLMRYPDGTARPRFVAANHKGHQQLMTWVLAHEAIRAGVREVLSGADAWTLPMSQFDGERLIADHQGRGEILHVRAATASGREFEVSQRYTHRLGRFTWEPVHLTRGGGDNTLNAFRSLWLRVWPPHHGFAFEALPARHM